MISRGSIKSLFRGFSVGLMSSAGMGVVVAFLLALTTIFGDSEFGPFAGVFVGFLQLAPFVVLVTVFYTAIVGMPVAALLRALNFFGPIALVVSGFVVGYWAALLQWPTTEPLLFAGCGALVGAAFWFGCHAAEGRSEKH